jgi:hypothetical protein
MVDVSCEYLPVSRVSVVSVGVVRRKLVSWTDAEMRQPGRNPIWPVTTA